MPRRLKPRKDLNSIIYSQRDTIVRSVFGERAASALFVIYSSWIQYVLYAVAGSSSFLILLHWLDLVSMTVSICLTAIGLILVFEVFLFFNSKIMRLLLKSFEWWLLVGFSAIVAISFCVIVDFDSRSYTAILLFVAFVAFASFDAQPRFKRKTMIDYQKVTMCMGILFCSICLSLFYANLVPRLRNTTLTIGAVTQDVLGILVSSLEALVLFFMRYLYNATLYPNSFAIVKAKVELETYEEDDPNSNNQMLSPV